MKAEAAISEERLSAAGRTESIAGKAAFFMGDLYEKKAPRKAPSSMVKIIIRHALNDFK